MTIDPESASTRKLIQRWIGAPQSADLNDPKTVSELLKDIKGLQAYLIEKTASKPTAPAPSSGASSFREVEHSTPNKSGTISPKGVVFHHSAGSFAGSLDWIKKSVSGVSYHVIVETDGTRHNVVPLTRRAWHAGKSKFKDKSGCNGFMVGFAFSGSTYQRSLTGDEIASAVEFVRKNRKQFGWKHDWMTDHRIVSPGRKDDLNPTEWERLQSALRAAF